MDSPFLAVQPLEPDTKLGVDALERIEVEQVPGDKQEPELCRLVEAMVLV